tara:strand:+ start:2907 stop:5051 length:2145 start_codon:yes stop_codon:yes gene_type:complete
MSYVKILKSFLFLFLFSFSLNVSSSIEDYFQYDVKPTSSNYGNTGILEMPNARFLKEGAMRFTFSASYPNEYTAYTASPFPFLEATYRYTEIKNRRYGPAAYSGNQTWKDKGFDLKLRLLEESYYWPSLALGLRDLAGTGSFSSEYLVGTKSVGNLDITLGIGWGIMGLDANINNPFSKISENYKDRSSVGSSIGGDISYNKWFRGNAALFGGLEYDLNKYGLKFKIEYDTSNPDIIPFPRIPVEVKSRINFGLNYYLADSLNFGIAFERGEELRISFALKGLFDKDTINKPKPKNVVKLREDQSRNLIQNKGLFYRSLNRSLRDESIYIQGASLDKDTVSVSVASNKFTSFPRIAGRAYRITSALTPESVANINLHLMNGDFEVAVIKLDKESADKAENFDISEQELFLQAKITSNTNTPFYNRSDFKPNVNFPEFSWNMSPGLKHQIGGPEAFYLGQLYWRTDTTVKFMRGLSLYTTFGIDIYNNFNELNNPSYSTIPHVRSDIQDYLKEGKNNIQRMQLEYMYSPRKDLFVRFDLGLLEEMFGGYGGEVLYRPFSKNIEYGLSLHRVKQRGFKQRFSFRDYETTTGHLGIYYDFPNSVSAKILAGKYLAGDVGLSLDLSRRFKTGFILGVFATKTNLSSIEFGEGSFDKGFYFSIPTKLFYSDYRRGSITFGLHPLTKDGGAILVHHHSLHGLLGDSNLDSFNRDWGDFLN